MALWDFFQTVRHRHSIRNYQTDMPVESEKLHAILEAACAAPSAGDLQSYSIHVVRDAAQRRALSAAAEGQSFVAGAPVCLVFFADRQRAATEYGPRGAELFAVQDAAIAAAYAQLAAVAAGLASTWVGNFSPTAVHALLDPDPGQEAVAILTLGYPAEAPDETPRRPLAELVTYR